MKVFFYLVSSVRPMQFSILDYLLRLQQQGLVISAIQVNLAAISAFHPHVDNHSIFSNDMRIRFVKGFNLILLKLMGPPFEPL